MEHLFEYTCQFFDMASELFVALFQFSSCILLIIEAFSVYIVLDIRFRYFTDIKQIKIVAEKSEIIVIIPQLDYCMDNAAMVACLGYDEYIKNHLSTLDIDVFSKSDI